MNMPLALKSGNHIGFRGIFLPFSPNDPRKTVDFIENGHSLFTE